MPTTYYFSRISINLDGDYLIKMQYLYEILTVSKAIEIRRDFYQIINVEIRKVGENNFITGNIVKYEAERNQPTVTDTKQIEDIIVKKPLLASVRFIYNSNESLLIYQEDRRHIPRETFGERFYKILFDSTNGNLAPMNISPINEIYGSFIDRLKAISEIKNITIKLQPSNPNNKLRWKKIDEKLQADRINRYTEIQKNLTPGESIIVDEETESKILMGEDGYGKINARGFDSNGAKISISTTDPDAQASASIENRENIEEEIEALKNKTTELKNKNNEPPH